MALAGNPEPAAMRGRAREALLEAAVHCITTLGYRGTTQRALVAASGANPRSIAYHYGSKEQLMAAGLVEAFRRRSVTVFRAAAEGGSAGEDRLATCLRALIESFEAEPDVAYALAEAIAETRSDALRGVFSTHYRDSLAGLTAVLDAELGEPYREAGADPAALASAFLALFDGLVLQWLVDRDELPEPGAIAHALATAFRLG